MECVAQALGLEVPVRVGEREEVLLGVAEWVGLVVTQDDCVEEREALALAYMVALPRLEAVGLGRVLLETLREVVAVVVAVTVGVALP